MYEYDPADLDSRAYESRKTPLYKHVAQTYAWMFLGLLVTFATSFTMYATGAVLLLLVNTWLPFALLIAKLALVIFLTARLHKFSVGAARAIFLGYSALTGVVFSTLFLIYGAGSAIFAFGMASLFFGAMAAAGLLTKRDLSKFGPLVLFGLVGLLLMTLVGMFLRFEGLDIAICLVGLALFMGITTYDAKKTKDLYYAFEGNEEMLGKVCIYSALNLYLDFINIFLYLLRLLGRRN